MVMTGYGQYKDRADVKKRQYNLDETARLVNDGWTSKQIAKLLGVSDKTVIRYRMELIAEGRIQARHQGRQK